MLHLLSQDQSLIIIAEVKKEEETKVEEQLVKQVKSEMVRTLLWLVIALATGVSVFYLVW